MCLFNISLWSSKWTWTLRALLAVKNFIRKIVTVKNLKLLHWKTKQKFLRFKFSVIVIFSERWKNNNLEKKNNSTLKILKDKSFQQCRPPYNEMKKKTFSIPTKNTDTFLQVLTQFSYIVFVTSLHKKNLLIKTFQMKYITLIWLSFENQYWRLVRYFDTWCIKWKSCDTTEYYSSHKEKQRTHFKVQFCQKRTKIFAKIIFIILH